MIDKNNLEYIRRQALKSGNIKEVDRVHKIAKLNKITLEHGKYV